MIIYKSVVVSLFFLFVLVKRWFKLVVHQSARRLTTRELDELILPQNSCVVGVKLYQG